MRNPWSAFYWRDYAGDTGHLTLVEHGAYLMLMSHYYTTGQPLPANAKQLQRICRAFAKDELAAVASVLKKFFVLTDGVYRHSRIDRELAKSSGISEKRRKAAQTKHANAEQMQSKSTASAEQVHTQSQSQSQSHKPRSKERRSPSLEEVRLRCLERGSPVDPEQFFAFYEAKGWMIGKNPVKDWKACLVTWERREAKDGNQFSKKQQRTTGNQRLIVEEMFGAEAGPGGESDELRDGIGRAAAVAIGSGRLLSG